MLRALKAIWNLPDTLDVGGWLCVFTGMAILGATALAPAWLDVRQLRHERSILQRQAALLETRRNNYNAFNKAVESNDPMVLQRLAWNHLRLVPHGTDLVETASVPQAAGIDLDNWMRPGPWQAPPLEPGVPPLPDTRLVRLLLGPNRPWVFAFGGWVLLLGLLTNPSAEKKAELAEERTAEGDCGIQNAG